MVRCWPNDVRGAAMSTLIRTDHLPATERFEFWRDVAYRTWVPMEARSERQTDFWARMHSSALGAIQANLMLTRAFSVRRTPALIKQSDPELLKIILPVRAAVPARIAQDGRQTSLGPADFALYDTKRPYEAGAQDHTGIAEVLTLMFPRSMLPLPDTQIGQLTAVRMRASEGVGALASRFLVQLAAGLDHYRPADAARLATTALDVLAARLAHELDGDHWLAPDTHQRALMTRIHAFIQQHLGDPELSPGVVADAHHISLRYLHKLFQEQGETVAGWIRQRRMERCRRDLADPALASRPVAAIAARWGFVDPGHFSRAFKAAHGLTPREYRREAAHTPDLA
jgi:AraC-like DNA-binding protein